VAGGPSSKFRGSIDLPAVRVLLFSFLMTVVVVVIVLARLGI
jgi:hypothetical protein